MPLAAGSAWAHQHAGTDAVAVTYFGDGAANIGSTLETMNLAAAWKLPLCFFIENNQYAVSTTVDEATAEPRLSARGPGFGIPSWKVDGMDPLAVHLAMQEAVDAHARRQRPGGRRGRRLPLLPPERRRSPAAPSATAPRTRRRQWRGRDPIDQVAAHLVRRGHPRPRTRSTAAHRPGEGR